jgi:hypothetical protein
MCVYITICTQLVLYILYMCYIYPSISIYINVVSHENPSLRISHKCLVMHGPGREKRRKTEERTEATLMIKTGFYPGKRKEGAETHFPEENRRGKMEGPKSLLLMWHAGACVKMRIRDIYIYIYICVFKDVC